MRTPGSRQVLTTTRTRLIAPTAALVLAGSACLSRSAPPTNPPGGQASSGPVRIGRVVRTDLSGVLTVATELKGGGTVAVSPQVAGQIAQLPVVAGTRVHAGQTLAQLDSGPLQMRLDQAVAVQKAAAARLAELKAGPSADAVALGNADLKAAEAVLAAAQGSSSGGADTQKLAQEVAAARASLDKLKQAAPDPQAVAKADSAVAAAQASLAQIKSDPTRSKDQAAVQAAQQNLQKAQAAAQAARQGPSSDEIAQAQQALDQALQAQQNAAQGGAGGVNLAEAQAFLAAAQAEQRLLSAGPAQPVIDAAQAESDEADANVKLAQAQLAAATITAPIDGVVSAVDAKVGTTVTPGAPLLTLVPPDLTATVPVDATQANGIKQGQAVKVSVQDLPTTTFSGSVRAVAPAVDAQSNSVAVEVTVSDPQGRLHPGVLAQMSIDTGRLSGVLVIPRSAVLHQSAANALTTTQDQVEVVTGNQVRRQPVVLGASDQNDVEVVSGLTEGTDILVTPRSDLPDGASLPASGS